MNQDAINRNEEAVAAYYRRFPKDDDVCVGHPGLIMDEPGLADFLWDAIEKGTPLTTADLEAKFGEIAWDW